MRAVNVEKWSSNCPNDRRFAIRNRVDQRQRQESTPNRDNTGGVPKKSTSESPPPPLEPYLLRLPHPQCLYPPLEFCLSLQRVRAYSALHADRSTCRIKCRWSISYDEDITVGASVALEIAKGRSSRGRRAASPNVLRHPAGDCWSGAT